MSKNKKEFIKKRYEALSVNPGEISFIDRIVADSRQVALQHTAGLSTPQQVQMAFFTAFDLIDKEKKYRNLTNSICRKRKKLLFEGLGINLQEDKYDASYYAEFDLLQWSEYHYGKEFGAYLKKNFKPIDILFKLAKKSSIVLLSGAGFYAPEWSIRISLANLNDESYSKIGHILHDILKDYLRHWKNN